MKAATIYADRLGWRVFPIKPNQKSPPLIQDWVNGASADALEVGAWVERFPGANIGLLCGVAFFVLDVDPRHGGDEALEALEDEHGELPETVQATTPSGGSHYLFQMVPGVTNSAGKVGDGLDIRGLGGYIVAAPSKTEAGQYRWVHAPWDHPIADAPEWLLAAVLASTVPTTDDGEPAPTDRGFFPAASTEVLAAAATALDRHGPAIEGKGGDAHTFRACALLVHDFALTDDEAWPLLLEWNADCQPEWDEDALRAKLTGGGKYGSAPYGCRRTLDALETTKKALEDWRINGGGEPALPAMTAKLRPLAAAVDATTRALMERMLCEATGLKPKDFALPKNGAIAGPLKRGEILVTTQLDKVADEAIKAIAPMLFARNGVLCEVVKQERTFIFDLEAARVQDLMSQASTYVRKDEKLGLVTQVPPERVATMLCARRTHEVRVLEAVTTAPIFLADGSILQERGYNAQARVFLEPAVTVDVPDKATHADAVRAVDVFKDLLRDFQFTEEADFTSWLAGLLSPLVKAATANAPSPLFCVSASSPGAGKTLLTDVIARVVTGLGAEVRPYNPRDPGEWGKRLTAFVKAASPVSVFDNCNGPIGDEGLDRLITAPTWSDRILGASDAPPLPNVTTWFATGNNIEPVGDTVRRALLTRLEVDTERPQERTGFKYPVLDEHALANRSELLSAALTILRAYHVAGRPTQDLPAWGSFTAWSALVRGSLVWAGLADPFLTQIRAAENLNEPENDAHDFWISIVEESDGTAGGIVTLANQRDAQSVLGTREMLTPLFLRRFLGRFVDKPRAGKRIRRDRDRMRNQVVYRVEAVAR